jgi:hypothetical protein
MREREGEKEGERTLQGEREEKARKY